MWKVLRECKDYGLCRHLEFSSVNHPMVILRLMKQDCWVCPLPLDTTLSLSLDVQMGGLNSPPWPLYTFCYTQDWCTRIQPCTTRLFSTWFAAPLRLFLDKLIQNKRPQEKQWRPPSVHTKNLWLMNSDDRTLCNYPTLPKKKKKPTTTSLAAVQFCSETTFQLSSSTDSCLWIPSAVAGPHHLTAQLTRL